MTPLSLFKRLFIISLTLLLFSCGGSSDSSGGNQAPTAEAGNNQIVDEQTEVILSGSGSDGDGTIVSYQWSQTSGTSVVLNNTDSSSTTFTAPALTETATLTFQLTVTDNTGSTVSDSVPVTVTPVISGIAQLGLISGGNVKLLDAQNLALIAETTTSSNSDNYGYFSFSGLSINNNDFYVLEVSEGVDTDPDDDGLIVEEEKVNNQGNFYAILTGAQLKQDASRVSLLTEALYTIAFDGSSDDDFSTLASRLNGLSITWLSDINEDGTVDYFDALAFDPLQHQDVVSLDYQQLLNLYVTAIYENKAKVERLKRLNLIFDHEIFIEGGNYQIAPFELKVSTNQLPLGVTTQWFVDGETSELPKGLQIQKGGISQLTAKLFYQGEAIGEIKKKLYTVETQLVLEQETSQDIDTVIDLSSIFNGGSVVIPAGATETNIEVQVNKVGSGIVPVEQNTVSEPLILGPAGTVFDQPVTISMPYETGIPAENLRIARYSADGEKDYLLPTYIDTDKSLVYFTTDHFTTFVVEEYDDCYRQSCKKIALHLQKIKELMAQHYKGDIDVTSWDDERWERVLNHQFNSQSEDTVYDHFLAINRIKVLSQVLAGTYSDAEHLNGINIDAKYLTAYKYLYPNDKVIEKAQERWDEIAKGLNAIPSIRGSATKLLNAKFFAAALTAIGLPTSKSEAIQYGIGKLLPIYNPVEVGKGIVKAANDIALNKNMEQYFSVRESLGLDGGVRAEYSHFNNAGFLTDNGWLSASYSSIPDINATDFFNNVEDMYQYNSRYIKAHKEAEDYTPYNLYCTNDNYADYGNCAEIENLTPEAAFAVMVITAYEQDELDQNPYFFVESYKVNDRELEFGGVGSPIVVEGASAERLVLTVNFKVVGNDNYLSEFRPNFAMSSADYSTNRFGFKSEDLLYSLEYEELVFINNGNGTATTNIRLTLPTASSGTMYEYGRSFKYEGELSTEITVKVKPPETIYYPPSAPTNVVVEPGDGFVSLLWDCLQDDVLAYNVHYRTTEYFSDTNVNALSNECGTKQKVILDLSNDTEYFLSVSATNSKGEGDSSVEVTATPQSNPSTGLSATAGDGEVHLSWNALPNATSYNVYYSRQSFDQTASLEYAEKSESISGTSYTVNDLTNGNFYYFVISANHGVAEGSLSDEVNSTPKPDGEKPQKPTGLTATMGVTSAVIQWGEDTNASGYQLFYSTKSFGSDPSSTIASGKSGIAVRSDSETTINHFSPEGVMDYMASSDDITQATITELEPGVQYYFTLRGINRVGASDFSDEISGATVTELTIPDALTGISVVSGESLINLSWDASPGATSYTLYYSTVSGLADNVFTVTNVTDTNYQLTNLVSDTTYYMVLTASNSAGESTDSTEVSATTNAPENSQVKFLSLSPKTVVAGTDSVLFTITGENLPDTLAIGFHGVNQCGAVTDTETQNLASITCDIPETNVESMQVYIKAKTGDESYISGAENIFISITPASTNNGFIQPCRDCGYSGAFDRDWHGDNTDHLAKDYPAFVGDEVLAITRGRVVKITTNQGGFGGFVESLGSDGKTQTSYQSGPAIVVLHTKSNGDNFYALYGHVTPSNNLQENDSIAAGEVLGTVNHYYATELGKERADWPHLHFGIWDAESNFPTTALGYGTDRSFVNPIPFLVNTLPESLSNITDLAPKTAVVGKVTTFTVTGENLPDTIAMSLAGSESCSSVEGFINTNTTAKINCTPLSTGEQPFYINNKSGGVYIPNSENLLVSVQAAQATSIVLGVNFTDQDFAICVQEHVTTQQVNDLKDLTSLNCSSRNIINVSELSFMTGLVSLDLHDNPIVEINLDASQSLNTVDLLGTSLSQTALDYLATMSATITNLSFPTVQPPQGDTSSFNTTWHVADGQQITIPTNSNYSYDYQVDWGDDSAVTTETGDATHAYNQAGTYTVKISGTFPAISFFTATGYSRESIVNIDQWGDIQWQSMYGAFFGCSNVVLKAIDLPNLSEVTAMTGMFAEASSFTGDLSNWDVSNVTDLQGMFVEASSFTSDLSNWDVSNVIVAEALFLDASSFTSDLSNWDVSNMTNLAGMFDGASSFTSDLSSWDVSAVTGMSRMFAGASIFDGDLSSWDVSAVTDMSWMFAGASIFNGDLSSWDVSAVTDMSWMFAGASIFNGDLSSWDVNAVTNMISMFNGSSAFNGDISGWDVGNVTNMTGLFYKASSFNGDISGWDVGNVTDMSQLFGYAALFNGNLSKWNVSNVTNMSGMFHSASLFNGNLSGWDVSNVTNMSTMFRGSTSFNSDISNWNVSKLTNAYSLFFFASSFNRDLSGWDVSSVTNMQHMFFEASTFTSDLSRWDVSQVTTLSAMFYNAHSFSSDLSNWEVSNGSVFSRSKFSAGTYDVVDPSWP